MLADRSDQPDEKRSATGIILDSLWLWTFLCLLTLFAFLAWAALDIQNHYYFVTAPFGTNGVPIR